jgi:hypothetical protein
MPPCLPPMSSAAAAEFLGRSDLRCFCRLSPGASNASAVVSVGGDSLVWVAAILSVPTFSVTLSAAPPPPAHVAMPITLSATVSGSTAPIECKWWLTANNWQTYSMLRDWGTCSYVWTPTVPGSYQVGVWARRSGSTANTVAEAHGGAPLHRLADSPVALTANRPSSQIAGSGVTTPHRLPQWRHRALPVQVVAQLNNWQSYTVLRTGGVAAAGPPGPGSYKLGSRRGAAEQRGCGRGLRRSLRDPAVQARTRCRGPRPIELHRPGRQRQHQLHRYLQVPTQTAGSFAGTLTVLAEDVTTLALTGTVTPPAR